MKTTRRIIALILTCALMMTIAPTALASNTTYFPKYTGSAHSIVDGFKAVGADSSFQYRVEIAKANSISNYTGTASQNTTMLNLLKQGKLIKPGSSGNSTATKIIEISNPFPNLLSLIEVKRDNAPIRSAASENGSVLFRCEEGAVLKYTSTVINKYGNLWYKVTFNGKTGYIYSGNVKMHTHSYQHLTYDGVTYNVCDCGKVTVTVKTTQKVDSYKVSMSGVAATAPLSMTGYASTAGGLAIADGPIPLGDIIGLSILVVGAYLTLTNSKPSTTQVQEIVRNIDFDSYLEQNGSSCSVTSYRRVLREGGTLKYIDDKCMNIGEAYVYVRYIGGDVYCNDQPTAMALAVMHGENNFYMERDKNQPTYFYHYHLGANAKHKVGGHIFFGTNELGQRPI